MNKFIIEQDLLQKLLDYLVEKPWKESNDLLVSLSKIKKIEDTIGNDIESAI